MPPKRNRKRQSIQAQQSQQFQQAFLDYLREALGMEQETAEQYNPEAQSKAASSLLRESRAPIRRNLSGDIISNDPIEAELQKQKLWDMKFGRRGPEQPAFGLNQDQIRSRQKAGFSTNIRQPYYSMF
jgi:predicted RNA polymerase sigma factor